MQVLIYNDTIWYIIFKCLNTKTYFSNIKTLQIDNDAVTSSCTNTRFSLASVSMHVTFFFISNMLHLKAERPYILNHPTYFRYFPMPSIAFDGHGHPYVTM
jgi:hypothetical protein